METKYLGLGKYFNFFVGTRLRVERREFGSEGDWKNLSLTGLGLLELKINVQKGLQIWLLLIGVIFMRVRCNVT